MVYLSGFKVGEKEVAGSHSHYMDDTILFFSSEVSSVWNLKMIITCFNRACVLKILVGEVAFLALVFQIQRSQLLIFRELGARCKLDVLPGFAFRRKPEKPFGC